MRWFPALLVLAGCYNQGLYDSRLQKVRDADNDGVPAQLDCDDQDPAVHPDAFEVIADGIDQDCNTVDMCYRDGDGDGAGIEETVLGDDLDCTNSPGEADNPDDCDDSDPDVHPGADEVVADGVDQDCDERDACYVDEDWDGVGVDKIKPGTSCDVIGVSDRNTDCDDNDDTVFPGATETPADGIDQDCDRKDHCFADTDGDGYGDPTAVAGDDMDCTNTAGQSATSDDCAPADDSIHPTATEVVADGIDQDCDTYDDCYQDLDQDGHGSAVTVTGDDLTCGDSPSDSATADDCAPNNRTISPSATETYYDGTDQDCDPTNEYDQDGDGFDSDEHGGEDCEDDDATVYPGVERTLEVPGDYGTIQAAIDAACPADTVSLAATGFTESIQIHKDITVSGDWFLTHIDGLDSQLPVTMSRGTLSDLTVHNGAGTDGGCVRIIDGQDVTVDVTLRACHATGNGGAIYIENGANITLSNNLQANAADADGGAVYATGTSGLSWNNLAMWDNVAGRAGALYLEDVTDINGDGTLLQDNTATDLAVHAALVGANTGILRSTVSVGGTGAAPALHAAGTVTLDSGALLLTPDVGLHLAPAAGQSVVASNFMVSDAGQTAIVIDAAAANEVELFNTLVAYNSGYGIDNIGAGAPNLHHNAAWQNDLGSYNGLTDPTGSNGNLLAAPYMLRFPAGTLASGDWLLQLHPDSPLVDAGDPLVADPDTSRSDIGFYGGPSAYDFDWYEDTDNDGLYDGYERDNGLDVTADDSAGDLDGDGLTNRQEFDLGTLPSATDSDGDGFDDSAENNASTNPLDAADHP